ncbi:hypothetical protein J2W34_000068 [Variovorax boronicumulans]|nr:hypothetical protein [Variovorax boronicumulans]
MSNTLSKLKGDGIVESVPETFLVGAAGRAELQRLDDVKAKAQRAQKARIAAKKRRKRAEARVAANPVVVEPVPRFTRVARAPIHAPNSVFDLARFA